MNKPFLDKLRKIDPYVPGEQPKTANVIKLNANENPYPPAPGVTEVLRTFDAAKLAVYPDANAKALKTALAEREGLKPSQIFLGNGSDDVLALAFQSFFCSVSPSSYPDITYSFYPVWCDLLRIPYETVPLDENFCINLRDYDKPNGGVILPNPNAPTGRALSLAEIEDLLQHNADCVVIIDEAYVDFGAESAISLIEKYENLLVVQTSSKSRSGSPACVSAMPSARKRSSLPSKRSKIRTIPIRWDSLALAVGEASIRDEVYFRETCRKVAATRDRAADELRALGFEVTPSLTNFLFATHPKKAAPKFSPPCAKRVSSSGISNCRASTITCASRSARTSRWTRSLLR